MRPQAYSPQHAEIAQTYLDVALAAGSKKVSLTKHTRGVDRISQDQRLETDRLSTIRDSLVKSMMRLHDSYPSFDHFSEFMIQLFEQEMPVAKVRLALGGINGICNTIKALTYEFVNRIKAANYSEAITRLRSSYIGRVSSFMRQAEKHLTVLNQARDAFRSLPSIDDELFTVAIAGFPNVGKSTLLSKMTTAKPEIKAYAFTTKGLNVGYFEHRYVQVQCIDTPGTLNRKQVNPIERKAEIALKYLSKVIVYVFDPMEGGYSLEEQDALYEGTKRYDCPIIVYISKSDIAKPDKIQELLEKYPDSFTVPDDVKKEIVKHLRKELRRG